VFFNGNVRIVGFLLLIRRKDEFDVSITAQGLKFNYENISLRKVDFDDVHLGDTELEVLAKAKDVNENPDDNDYCFPLLINDTHFQSLFDQGLTTENHKNEFNNYDYSNQKFQRNYYRRTGTNRAWNFLFLMPCMYVLTVLRKVFDIIDVEIDISDKAEQLYNRAYIYSGLDLSLRGRENYFNIEIRI
jgi:hypothetical protein